MGEDSYPSIDMVLKMIKPFAREMVVTNASNICAKGLGNPIFGNVMAIGVALSKGMLPLKKASIIKAIKSTVPKGIDKNMKAFEWGLALKG